MFRTAAALLALRGLQATTAMGCSDSNSCKQGEDEAASMLQLGRISEHSRTKEETKFTPLIIEDGVKNEYYLTNPQGGSEIIDDGMTVKFTPPHRYYLMNQPTQDFSKSENFYKPDKIKPAETRLLAHGEGRVISELVASIEANSSTSNCPCTWNAAYPCSVHGKCYPLTTKSSCESYGDGGDFCVSSPPSSSPPSTPAPPPVPSSSVGGWKQDVLDKTNQYRAEHNAPALTWDDSLANEGQTWANKCDFKHDSTSSNGQNLYAWTGSFNGASAVTKWYDEIKSYNFNNPGFSGSTGHFTQLVWKSTTQVGCGLKLCSYLDTSRLPNAYLLVCEYSPMGNWKGEFAANVLH